MTDESAVLGQRPDFSQMWSVFRRERAAVLSSISQSSSLPWKKCGNEECCALCLQLKNGHEYTLFYREQGSFDLFAENAPAGEREVLRLASYKEVEQYLFPRVAYEFN